MVVTEKILSYQYCRRKTHSSHSYTHLTALPFAGAKEDRIPGARLRYSGAATAHLSMHTRWAAAKPWTQQQHRRKCDDHKRNQLLPIHKTNIPLNASGATGDFRVS
jgi:hypothetical protein